VTVAPLGILTFAHGEQWEIYLVSALIGIGLGFAFAAMSNIIVEAVPPSQTGVASGMNANIRTIGGAIGAAVTGSIVTSNASAAGIPHESGYTHGFGFLFLGTLVATAAVFGIPSGRKRGNEIDAEIVKARDEEGVTIVRNPEAALVPNAALLELE
jgi:MFS family permease